MAQQPSGEIVKGRVRGDLPPLRSRYYSRVAIVRCLSQGLLLIIKDELGFRISKNGVGDLRVGSSHCVFTLINSVGDNCDTILMVS